MTAVVLRPRRPVGSLAAAAVACTVLAACASSSSVGTGGASPGPAGPAGISSAAWPTDDAAVKKVVAAAPQQLDGWTAKPLEERTDPTSFAVDYASAAGAGTHRPAAGADRPSPQDGGPLGYLVGLLAWAGAPQGCVDMTGSPTALAAVQGMADRTPAAVPTPDPAAVEWIACTSVVNVDGGPGTLPPDLQEHLLVWTARGWTYYVSGRTEAMRDQIASAVVAAAR